MICILCRVRNVRTLGTSICWRCRALQQRSKEPPKEGKARPRYCKYDGTWDNIVKAYEDRE